VKYQEIQLSDEYGGDHEEHEGGHEEPWLISYADLMTLLFGFFVLMYVFAQAKLDRMPDDVDKMVHLRKEIAKHFGGEYITPLKKASENLQGAVKSLETGKDTVVKLSPEGIEVTFLSNVLYRSGSAELLPQTRKKIETLANLVLKEKGDYSVHAEGHTDDMPIVRYKAQYPTNWELSSARATAVVRVFEKQGFKSKNLVAIGYGSSRPAYANRDEKGKPILDNMAKNRRMKIKVSLVEYSRSDGTIKAEIPSEVPVKADPE
jgi:chemotaxis protein MotB